jgi:Domain of unknown function (DUF397)
LSISEHAQDTTLTWRKASRSTAGNDCVEIARTTAGYLIRDSKNPNGPRLSLDAPAWAALIDDVKNDRYRQ